MAIKDTFQEHVRRADVCRFRPSVMPRRTDDDGGARNRHRIAQVVTGETVAGGQLSDVSVRGLPATGGLGVGVRGALIA